MGHYIGSHSFQHYKLDDAIRALVKAGQADSTKVSNMKYIFKTQTDRLYLTDLSMIFFIRTRIAV